MAGGITVRYGFRLHAGLLLLSIKPVECCCEIRHKVLVLKGLFTSESHVDQKTALMVADLGCAGFECETGIPCTPAGVIEAAAVSSRMAECGVDDVRLGNSHEKLAGPDRTIAAPLRKLAFVRGSVDFAQIAEHLSRETEFL